MAEAFPRVNAPAHRCASATHGIAGPLSIRGGTTIRRLLLAAAAAAVLPAPLAAQRRDAPASAASARILDQGTNHSQVMQTVQHLTDVIGPRLTNSPQMRAAEAWTAAKFAEWGLANVRKEGFAFGRGWSIERSSVRMVTPRPLQLTAIPIAWTPAADVTGAVVVAPMRREEDFAKYRGQLRGKVVMVTRPGEARDATDPAFRRLSGDELRKLDQFEQPRYDPAAADRRVKRLEYAKKLDTFLAAEGAVAYATMSRLDGKLVHGEGYPFGTQDTPKVPGVEIAAEDYRRLARFAKSGPAPTLEVKSDVRFDDRDTQAYNVFAEIPGTDRVAGYVMAGAHLDSWVAADGAADNAAGSAMVMEAARILAATGIRPRRTIRFALWAGEEQGLLGSLNYVERYLATRGDPGQPALTGLQLYYGWANRWPIRPRPGWSDLTAYFNIDNGSGKLRGLYAENNPAVVPIFREWLAPYAGFGADTVVLRPTGGTDHVFMQAVGAPGFQFIQDPLDYGSRVHHTSIDTFDHLQADDMRQGATVLAGVLLAAANADKALPRGPVPTRPTATAPFAYPDEDD